MTPKNFALVTLCIASLRRKISPRGFRFFFLDIINICVLFTLRVSLLESNHYATLGNSELRIWIAPSIESCWTYSVVSSAKRANDNKMCIQKTAGLYLHTKKIILLLLNYNYTCVTSIILYQFHSLKVVKFIFQCHILGNNQKNWRPNSYFDFLNILRT